MAGAGADGRGRWQGQGQMAGAGADGRGRGRWQGQGQMAGAGADGRGRGRWQGRVLRHAAPAPGLWQVLRHAAPAPWSFASATSLFRSVAGISQYGCLVQMRSSLRCEPNRGGRLLPKQTKSDERRQRWETSQGLRPRRSHQFWRPG